MKKYILYILVFLLSGVLFGQNNKKELPHETIFLSCDRNIYCQGEQILFTLFSMGFSSVAYVDLYSKDGSYTISQSVMPVNNKYQGIISIPQSTPSGSYTLRAYTYYQKNFNANEFTSVPVFILSGEIDKKSIKKKQSGEAVSTKRPESIALIETNKNTFHTREKVVVNITPYDTWKESISIMTVSVVKKGSGIKTSSCITPTSLSGRNLLLPELKDPVIHGVIEGDEGSEINLYLSEPGSDQGLRITTSDQDGNFYFPVLPYSGEKTFAITTELQGNKTDSLMILSNTSTEYPSPDTTFKPSEQLAKDLLRNAAVHNSFTTYTNNIKSIYIPESGLPGDTRYSIRLKDFIQLNSLREVFTEITPYVKLRSENGNESLAVLDDRRDILYKNPLVLLDGTPVFDFEELFKIHPAKVDSIKVINRRYLYGSHSLDGIIMIQTNTNDFGAYDFKDKTVFFSLNGIEPSRRSTLNNSGNDFKESPMPDFRTTLFWDGDLLTNGYQGKIEFYTSDDTGEYQIIVSAISKNGKLYSNRYSFSVLSGK